MEMGSAIYFVGIPVVKKEKKTRATEAQRIPTHIGRYISTSILAIHFV
jgi:hypothetical protein